MTTSNKGTRGERLIADFFDWHFSQLFSFPNPKSKANVEVADLLVWWNREVLLVEVKTKDKARCSADQWAKARIQDAVKQLLRNSALLRQQDTVNLHNRFYHTPLLYDGVKRVIGLIILLSEEPLTLNPTDAVGDIYQQTLPIHVLSWSDLKRMTLEIDTVPDLIYYLRDRFQYFRRANCDIPVGCEMDVLGLYKMNNNAFPKVPVAFRTSDYWTAYLRARESLV